MDCGVWWATVHGVTKSWTSMGFSRQEYWSGLLLPSPGDLPDPGPFQYPIILPFHSVHGVLKARILKWFAIPFSRQKGMEDKSSVFLASVNNKSTSKLLL